MSAQDPATKETQFVTEGDIPAAESDGLDATTTVPGLEPELVGATAGDAGAIGAIEETESLEAANGVTAATDREPRFVPQDEKYLTDRAVDLELARLQKARSGTEAEIRMYLRRSDVVGGGLCIWYPQQEPPYLRVQLHSVLCSSHHHSHQLGPHHFFGLHFQVQNQPPPHALDYAITLLPLLLQHPLQLIQPNLTPIPF